MPPWLTPLAKSLAARAARWIVATALTALLGHFGLEVLDPATAAALQAHLAEAFALALGIVYAVIAELAEHHGIPGLRHPPTPTPAALPPAEAPATTSSA